MRKLEGRGRSTRIAGDDCTHVAIQRTRVAYRRSDVAESGLFLRVLEADKGVQLTALPATTRYAKPSC
jgi:hypothetical protein